MSIDIYRRKSLLEKELDQYESDNEMSTEERAALYEWVDAGNSVHENTSLSTYEDGTPLDFLDVYRYEKSIRQELDSLNPQDQETYLARLRGENTIETLTEDISEMSFKLAAYHRILKEHHLLSEAEVLMKCWKENAIEIPEVEKGLPFI